MPYDIKSKWEKELTSELEFWDDYFRTKGLEWADSYWIRFDPNYPLQSRPAALLPETKEVSILDVGAGPLTSLGKSFKGKDIRITAIDPLAEEYDKLLAKYDVRSPIRTQKLSAEELTTEIPSNSFDLVYARNSIDHSYNPEKAVLEMITAVKQGFYVLMEHRPNEGENQNYAGLHQWNFSISDEGDFLIRSESFIVNMTEKYARLCTIQCELVQEEDREDWLVTRIKKK